jgi:hypothetical protein
MNLFDWFFKQIVTQGQMDWAFDQVQDSILAATADPGLVGILSGLGVTEHAPTADMTVDVATGVAYDAEGQRIYVPDAITVVDCSVDEYGVPTDPPTATFQRYLSVFAAFDRELTDKAYDGNGVEVWTHHLESFRVFVRQGAEAGAGTAVPPPLLPDAELLTDILITSGQTAILNAHLDTDRRQDWLRAWANPGAGYVDEWLVYGQPAEAIEAVWRKWNEHVSDLGWFHGGGVIAYTPGQTWFGAVPLSGPAAPVTSVAEALDAILYDLADAGPPAGDALISATDFTGTYLAWAAASIAGAIAITAGALDAHIGGAAPQHPATAITTDVITGTPEEETLASEVQTVLQHVFDHLNDRTQRSTAEVISGAWRFFEGTIGPSVTAGRDNANPRFARKLFAQSIQGGSQSPSTTKARIAAGLYSGEYPWASPLSEANTIDNSSTGDQLADICVLFDAAGSRRIYVFDDATHKAYWFDPEDKTISGDWDFTALFPAPAGLWGISSVCTDGTNLFISVWDTGGLNVHHIAACDKDGVALAGWAGGSTVLPGNGLSPLALSQTAKIIVAKINPATGLATRICCANDWQNCDSGLSVTTIDAADGSIIASGDGSGAGYPVPADWYPSGGMCSDGVHVYVTACDPSGAPPIMTGAGFYHCNIEDPALFVALAGVPADLSTSRTQEILWDGALLWVPTFSGLIATYEMASEAVMVHSAGLGIGPTRHAVLDGLNLWAQVMEAADNNIMIKMIPCAEYQSTTIMDLSLSVRFSAGMTLEDEAAVMSGTRMGRMCFDGDSVWVIISEVGGTDGSGIVRRVPRAGIR